MLTHVPRRYALFQKRKPGGQNQWSEKLPDFVKRLEHALFNSASTKVSAMFLLLPHVQV